MNIVAHLTCDICNDTWFRDMDDRELDDYIAEHPKANFRMITDPNDGTYVDLEGIICDGCEDFYTDESALALAEDEEIEAQYLEERKEDACAAAGTGEFWIWHFDPELGTDE